MIPEWTRIRPDQQRIISEYIQTVPVKIGALARALGLEVKASTLKPGTSGQIQRARTPSGFEIKVNRHEAPNRQRFTIAHEIAHFLLHSDAIGDGIEDSILYRSPKMGDKREFEANKLAAELLMPRAAIQAHLHRLGGKPTKDVAKMLADDFGTSEDAMRIRIGVR